MPALELRCDKSSLVGVGVMEVSVRSVAKTPQNKQEARIRSLEATVTELELHVQALQGFVITTENARGGPQAGDDTVVQRTMRDNVWCCANCGARLGVYNSEKDELRIRYKDFCVYITPGTGGTTMVPCRRCGEQNLLQDTRTMG